MCNFFCDQFTSLSFLAFIFVYLCCYVLYRQSCQSCVNLTILRFVIFISVTSYVFSWPCYLLILYHLLRFWRPSDSLNGDRFYTACEVLAPVFRICIPLLTVMWLSVRKSFHVTAIQLTNLYANPATGEYIETNTSSGKQVQTLSLCRCNTSNVIWMSISRAEEHICINWYLSWGSKEDVKVKQPHRRARDRDGFFTYEGKGQCGRTDATRRHQ